MKTIMDAVNEYMATWPDNHQMLDFHCIALDVRDGEFALLESRASGNRFEHVCRATEFYDLVHELSHAAWIKGASLAEYQAADKEVLKPCGSVRFEISASCGTGGDGGTGGRYPFGVELDGKGLLKVIADKEVLKVENKTVEVDGMVYEIGKYYVFADSLDSVGYYDKLKSISLDGGYKFASSSGAEWRYCSPPTGETGTITPAPVKLVGGEAYRFTVRGKMFNGIYESFGDKFNVMAGQFFNLANCTNIIPLVPEGANSLSK